MKNSPLESISYCEQCRLDEYRETFSVSNDKCDSCLEIETKEKASYFAETLACQLDNNPKEQRSIAKVFELIAVNDSLDENQRIDAFAELKKAIDVIVENVEI